jgi:uncharacterized protein
MKAPDDVLRVALSHHRLNLILMPTEQCNFRCTYCYESFQLGRMKPDVVAGVKRLMERRAPELAELTISWFGGEPLLALDLVEDVMTHAQELRGRHPAMRVRSNLTTNAWKLDRPVFERLLALGVNDYQISFDGPKELHDQKRVRRDGRGSFDRIWSNLRAMRGVEGSFLARIRVHVDRSNLAALPRFLADVRAEFGGDPRFRVHLKPLAKWGGPNDAQLDVLDQPGDRERLHGLEQLLGEQSVMALESGSAAPSGPDLCYATRANSFDVRADGRLNNCTIALDRPENHVGRIEPDGRLVIEPEPMRTWMRGLHSGDERELFCPLLGLDAWIAREARNARPG